MSRDISFHYSPPQRRVDHFQFFVGLWTTQLVCLFDRDEDLEAKLGMAYYIIRQPPFSTAQLIDVDYSIDFAQVTTSNDRAAVITTNR
jgi:predicted glutamine amidotransferase